MKEHIDYLGRELCIGDEVVFMQIGYRNFVKGIIIKLTDKTALISHKPTNTCSTESKQFYRQIIKVSHA